MDKNNIIYLAIFIVIYIYFRSSTKEKFNNNIKNISDLENQMIIEREEQRIKLAHESRLPKPTQLFNQMPNQTLPEENGIITIFKNTNNYINSNIIQPASDINYVEKFNQVKEKVYEYMTAYNTAKLCDFKYSLTNSTTLIKGQMNLTHNVLKLFYADLSGNVGININLASHGLMIGDGSNVYYLTISKFDSTSDPNGYLSVNVDISGVPSTFLNNTSVYTLYPCSNQHDTTNLALDSQLYFSCIIFVIFILIVGIVVNYKVVLNMIWPKTKNTTESLIPIHEGGKQQFYIGGYDYMDYSD